MQEAEPMSVVEARYRTFIRLGRPHDPLCYECFQPGKLQICNTCRRSCHEECMPQPPGSRWVADTGDPNTWYCPVCVARGWDDPKRLPPLGPDDKPKLDRYSWRPQILMAHTNAPPGTTYETSLFTSARPDSGNSTGVPSTTACVTGAAMQLLQSTDTGLSNGTTRGAEGSCFESPAALRAASGSVPSASATSLRKSRFNTLSDEVDSALSIVYRELEEVPLLHKTVADLESKIASLRQELSIYKNEIALSKRMGGGSGVKGLTARKNDLERENASVFSQQSAVATTDLRAQLEKSNQMLKEWKEKLAGMLGE
ncbi:hypothetical protein BDV10DRAFT_167325 [Aspergillus recurvatus]